MHLERKRILNFFKISLKSVIFKRQNNILLGMNRHILLFMVLLCLTMILFNLTTVAETKQSSTKIEVPPYSGDSYVNSNSEEVYYADVNVVSTK